MCFVKKLPNIFTILERITILQSAKYKVFRAIQKNGRGYVFSANDIHLDLPSYAIARSLVDLEKDGKIVRVFTGMYYYPEYNPILKRNAAPDIWKVAKAIARKYSWNIFPEGNTALNYLGLSTQVPGQYIYISDGIGREYKVGNAVIKFLHREPKDTQIKGEKANLVVQALKALGKSYATNEDFVKQLSTRFTKREWEIIEKATRNTAQWMKDVIKQAKDLVDD